VERVAALWRAVGRRSSAWTRAQHDRVLAAVSHLPHLLAFNAVNTADDVEHALHGEVLKYAAGGFRDFTRIAGADPAMWRDVFLHNRPAVLEVVGRYVENLAALQRAIRRGEADALYERVRQRARDPPRSSSHADGAPSPRGVVNKGAAPKRSSGGNSALCRLGRGDPRPTWPRAKTGGERTNDGRNTDACWPRSAADAAAALGHAAPAGVRSSACGETGPCGGVRLLGPPVAASRGRRAAARDPPGRGRASQRGSTTRASRREEPRGRFPFPESVVNTGIRRGDASPNVT
jgi:hypothetical protein